MRQPCKEREFHVSGKRPPWPGSPSRTNSHNKQQTTNNNNNNPAPAAVTWYKCFFSPFSLSLPSLSLPTEGSVTLLNAHQREREREERAMAPIIHLPILPFALICCLFFIFPSLLCIRASQLLHVHDHGVEERDDGMASVSGKPASCSGMPVSPLAFWCRPVWNSPRAGNLRAPLFFSHPARVWAARHSAGCPHLGALTGTLSRCPPPPGFFLCPRCPVATPPAFPPSPFAPCRCWLTDGYVGTRVFLEFL